MSLAGLWAAFARLPIAWFAIPLIVTLTLWRSNSKRVPYEDALPALLSVLAAALALLLLMRWMLGGWRRAALATAVWTAFIFYGRLAASYVSSATWLQWVVLAALALFAFDVTRRIPRDEDGLRSANGWTNALVVLPALGLLGWVAAAQVRAELSRPDPARTFARFEGAADPSSPDVWHLIFDRYASEETLRRVYRHDNRPFLDALRSRGFAVGENIYSNYPRTAHSVASTLNASYLEPLARTAESRDSVPLYRAMTDNAALRFFGGQGYRTIFAGSWWNPTRHSPIADENINYRALPELGRLLLDQSVPGLALEQLGLPYGDGRRDQCLRVGVKFQRLAALAAQPGRKYVFGHFLVPHPPFVLNPDGSCRSLAQARAASRRDNYVAQIVHQNREILTLVDAIRAGPRPAIIIVHSDEGPWPEPYVGDEHSIGRDPVPVDWEKLKVPQLREKMGVLLAVRHPDGQPRPLPASPVNIYPAILQDFGGADRSLPDRSYVYRSESLYAFVPIDEKLSRPLR